MSQIYAGVDRGDSALPSRIRTRGLPSSKEMGSSCISMFPKVTRSVGLVWPILRRCISSICRLVPFSLHSRLSPGEWKNFSSAILFGTCSSLGKAYWN